MSFTRGLHNLTFVGHLVRAAKHRRPSGRPRPAAGFRPRLEILEDRTAPALLTVKNGDDTGADSLRAAIAVANTNGEEDTIQFAADVKKVTLTSEQLTITAPHLTTIIGDGVTVARRDFEPPPPFRIFEFRVGSRVNLTGLTITNGSIGGPVAGAGIFNSGTLTITNSSISRNAAAGFGGGIFNNGPSLTITNCLIFDNILYFSDDSSGAGIYNDVGDLFIINSTISGNSAIDQGGGIYNTGNLTSINCTITNNQVDYGDTRIGLGGGILCNGVETLRNTLIVNNFNDGARTMQNLYGVPNTVTNCLTGPESSYAVPDGVNGNIVTTTPLLGSLADNGGRTQTHALLQNSPAIGAASQSAPGYIGYDQRGAFRDPGDPDIGAYEVQHPLSPVGTPSTYANTFLPKPSPDANTAFVKGLYQSTLLRGPDPAGLANWVAQLNGGANRQSVTYGFINSIENRTAQVTFFYRYFLGRSPDPDGLTNWVSTLQSGVDEGTVMSGFLLSPEFTGQNDNASFVNLMYYAILGRQSDPAGFASWKNQLDSGALTRDQVGNGFLRSVESIRRVVTSYFGSYLKRTIDSAAAAPYVSQSQAGVTFGRIAANILGSDEFFVAAGQNLN